MGALFIPFLAKDFLFLNLCSYFFFSKIDIQLMNLARWGWSRPNKLRLSKLQQFLGTPTQKKAQSP